MGTRAYIGKIEDDGSTAGIFCCCDGYPSQVGKILEEHYSLPEKLDSLLALGDISILAAEVGQQHSFANPTAGWTLAFHRDNGEAPSVLHVYYSVSHALHAPSNYDYMYFFDPRDSTWLCGRRGAGSVEPLNVAIARDTAG